MLHGRVSQVRGDDDLCIPKQGVKVTKIWCTVSRNLNSSAVIESDTSSALSQAQKSGQFTFEH